MIVVVNDANILIDLVKLELLPHFFALDMHFHTTNLILDELNLEQKTNLQPYLEEGKLEIYNCTDTDLMEIGIIGITKPALSTQDCSAIWLAQAINGLLITSDNTLRKTAKLENLNVHGHFWVFDRLFDAGLLNGVQAIEKLNQLCTIVNTKLGLPKDEIEKRIKYWII